MNLRRALPSLLILSALAAPGGLAAQTVRGIVQARLTETPVNFARLVLVTEAGDSVAATLSNRSGGFQVTAPGPGSFYLAVTALGYKDTTVGVFDLGADGVITVELRLQYQPIMMEGLAISAPPGVVQDGMLIRNGFYERLTSGLGRFITPADIAESHALHSTDLLENIPRVRVVSGGAGGLGGDRILMSNPLGNCGPRIYVDNVLMSRDGSDFDLVVPIVAIEAIEVYRGASEVPIQWGGTNGGCGAIVVWTKR